MLVEQMQFLEVKLVNKYNFLMWKETIFLGYFILRVSLLYTNRERSCVKVLGLLLYYGTSLVLSVLNC